MSDPIITKRFRFRPSPPAKLAHMLSLELDQRTAEELIRHLEKGLGKSEWCIAMAGTMTTDESEP